MQISKLSVFDAYRLRHRHQKQPWCSVPTFRAYCKENFGLHRWRHGERGARAYNGGLGAEPPAGSRGIAPGQGFRGQSPPPPEADSILAFER